MPALSTIPSPFSALQSAAVSCRCHLFFLRLPCIRRSSSFSFGEPGTEGELGGEAPSLDSAMFQLEAVLCGASKLMALTPFQYPFDIRTSFFLCLGVCEPSPGDMPGENEDIGS